jgi:hypothetical protein
VFLEHLDWEENIITNTPIFPISTYTIINTEQEIIGLKKPNETTISEKGQFAIYKQIIGYRRQNPFLGHHAIRYSFPIVTLFRLNFVHC